jgi:3-hydroxyisobutyrate dehydrogenase-like beta-hydroxyacid dehydrogenase
LPLTALATRLYRLHDGKGHGELDITSILTLYESTVR